MSQIPKKQFPIDQFNQALKQTKKVKSRLAPFISQFNKLNMQWIYQTFNTLYIYLNQPNIPFVYKFNSLNAIRILFDTSQLILVNWIQVFFLPKIYKIVQKQIQLPSKQRGKNYFIDCGYTREQQPQLQKFGYNYILLALELLQVAALVKPHKLYQTDQLNQQSNYSLIFNTLIQNGYQKPKELLIYRKQEQIQNQINKYHQNLQKLANQQQSQFYDIYSNFYIDKFYQYIEQQHNIQKEQQNYQLPILKLLENCDIILIYDAIQASKNILLQMNDLISINNSLDVFDKLMISGNFQAFVTLNNQQTLVNIFNDIININKGKDFSLQQRSKVFLSPTHKGKQSQKIYIKFLQYFQKWADMGYRFLQQQNKSKDKNWLMILKKSLAKNLKIQYPQLTNNQSQMKLFNQNLSKNMEINIIFAGQHDLQKDSQLKKIILQIQKNKEPSISQLQITLKNQKKKLQEQIKLKVQTQKNQKKKIQEQIKLKVQTEKNQKKKIQSELSQNLKRKFETEKNTLINQNQINKLKEQPMKIIQSQKKVNIANQAERKIQPINDQVLKIAQSLKKVDPNLQAQNMKQSIKKNIQSNIQSKGNIIESKFNIQSRIEQKKQILQKMSSSKKTQRLVSKKQIAEPINEFQSKLKQSNRNITRPLNQLNSQNLHYIPNFNIDTPIKNFNFNEQGKQISESYFKKNTTNNKNAQSSNKLKQQILKQQKYQQQVSLGYQQQQNISINKPKQFKSLGGYKIDTKQKIPSKNKIENNLQDSRNKIQISPTQSKNNINLGYKIQINPQQSRVDFQKSERSMKSSIIQDFSQQNYKKSKEFILNEVYQQPQQLLQDQINSPMCQPMQQSFHDIDQIQQKLRQNLIPSFKKCFQADKYILSQDKNTKLYWLENGTNNLIKSGISQSKHKNSKIKSKINVPQILQERNKKYQDQIKLIQQDKNRKIKQLQYKIKNLQSQTINMKSQINSQKQQIQILKTNSEFDTASVGQKGYLMDMENIAAHKLVSPIKHTYTNSKNLEASFYKENKYLDPTGKLITSKNYKIYFQQFKKQKEKKGLLKNKQLLHKDKQIEIGCMTKKQNDKLIITFYITPDIDIYNLTWKINQRQNLQIHNYGQESRAFIGARKQQKVQISVRVLQAPYYLPVIQFIYEHENQSIQRDTSNHIKLIIPCSFHKFFLIKEINDKLQQHFTKKQHIIRGQQVPYSKKLLKNIDILSEYFPFISLLHKGHANQKGQITFGGMAIYQNIQFAVKISIKPNQFLYIQANKNTINEKYQSIVQFYICLLTHLLMKDIQ